MDSKTFKFGAYQKDDVFLSPPTSIPSKPKSNTQPKKSTTNARRIIDYDDDMSTLDDSVLGHRQVLDQNPQINPHRPEYYQAGRTVPSPNLRPQLTTPSQPFYQEESSRTIYLQQAASVAVTPAPPPPFPSLSRTSTSSRNVSAPAKSTAEGKQAAALSTIAEDEDCDMMGMEIAI
ncbi:hypothetical protein FRC05_008937 [Tulasnella sp. 425]|nr:hypothetical protein FRC05_008937 [Tulasnella sp. 425]